MTTLFASVSTLLLSAAILLTGHGLQLTLAPLFASEMGWSAQEIGYTGSAYFSGFMIGCLTIPRLVERVGHIRVFAVLASLASIAVLLLGLLPSMGAWLFARLLTGIAFSGLYMVIESWLNERVTGEHRGAVLSVYTIITLAAIALGQVSVGFGLDYATLTVLAAIIFCIGLIPVGLTRSPSPPLETVSFRLREVFQTSQVAVVGAFVGGAVTSGIWALGPIVGESMGLALDQIGFFMAITIIGGAVFQFPVGRLSDSMDRRIVILNLAAAGSVLCIIAIILGGFNSALAIYLVMFVFGGVTFPLYSLCVAHANDNTKLALMEIASVVLLMHSAGSIFGPLMVAPLLDTHDSGLFMFAGVVLAVFAVWTAWRLQVHDVARRYFAPFIGVPRTTHEIATVVEAEVEAADFDPPPPDDDARDAA